MTKIFWAKNFQSILRGNGLHSFDALWGLDIGPVENPNRRRGGHSFVGRMALETPDGSPMAVFLKRQENDMARTLMPPFKIPSYERELKNILRFEKMDIPVVAPMFFEKQKRGNNVRAILMTKALEGYRSFESCLKGPENSHISVIEKERLFSNVALLIRQIHQKGFEHGALFGKHIYIRTNRAKDEMDIRFLDLEMARRHPNRMLRDLTRLYHRTSGWNEENYLLFLSSYLKETGGRSDPEKLWKRIGKRIRSKTQPVPDLKK